MRIFRRRSKATLTVTSKEAALVEAREAAASARREKAKLERYRAKKQAEPVEKMTTNQWLAGGS